MASSIYSCTGPREDCYELIITEANAILARFPRETHTHTHTRTRYANFVSSCSSERYRPRYIFLNDISNEFPGVRIISIALRVLCVVRRALRRHAKYVMNIYEF